MTHYEDHLTKAFGFPQSPDKIDRANAAGADISTATWTPVAPAVAGGAVALLRRMLGRDATAWTMHMSGPNVVVWAA
jgi:hypothetical protein